MESNFKEKFRIFKGDIESIEHEINCFFGCRQSMEERGISAIARDGNGRMSYTISPLTQNSNGEYMVCIGYTQVNLIGRQNETI